MKRKHSRILIACEESQVITKAFRERGFEAFSCDLLDCSGGHPEWHIKGDVLEVLEDEWDLMVAHPPCTYLAVSGARWLYNRDGTRNKDRWEKKENALKFVKDLMEADIEKIAIENPISMISSNIRKPDQIVHPYFFGEKVSKSTCLWLKNLPLLQPTNMVSSGEWIEWVDSKTGKKKRQNKWDMDIFKHAKTAEDRQRLRSKTFQGIANAIADQWSARLIPLDTSIKV